MEVHKANKRKGEVNDIPDGHICVSQEYVDGVEIIKTKEGHECDVCSKVFSTKSAMNGHMSSHEGSK